MSLHFTGELSLWLALVVAAAGVVATWWLYRGERPSKWKWLLPVLRGFAVFASVMLLTQPVIKRSKTIDQKSRVLVFIDGSRSMSVDDHYETAEHKLLIARANGWLPENALDVSLVEAADALANARWTTAEGRRPGTPPEVLQEACGTFARLVSQAAKRKLPEALARRFDDELMRPADALAGRTVDKNNQSQIRSLLNSLAQLSAQLEENIRVGFATYARQLTGAEVEAALKKFNAMTRWQREQTALLRVLKELPEKHEVELLTLPGGDQAEPWWSSLATKELPGLLTNQPNGMVTDLASGIQSHLPAVGQRTAVVLLSDGRQNAPTLPVQTAKLLANRQAPLFTVQVGDARPRPDLAILALKYNEVVFQDDVVRGAVDIQDTMAAGTTFGVKIESAGQTLWQSELTTQGTGARRLPFSFSIKELIPTPAPPSVSLPMTVTIAPLAGEDRTDNNQRPFYVVKANMPTTKVLVIDGRPRWETRYIRDLFSRDPRWKINNLVLLAPGDLKLGSANGQFPADRESLFAYDLIVFGEVRPKTFNEEQLGWLRDFVQHRGGGLVLIDGQRQHLRAYADTLLGELMPVVWKSQAGLAGPKQFQLTDTGALQSFLGLLGSAEQNALLWRSLPLPQWAAFVEPKPGAETLVELLGKTDKTAALVLRRYGAGQVLYSAFDETWRWRYRVADEYHQRYWNQVGNSIMEKPFAVADKLVSLDTSALIYQAGQTAGIRARLRTADGRPITSAKAEAVLTKDGKPVASVVLVPDPNGGGLYRATTTPLAEGRYELSVKADGISSTAKMQFTVMPVESVELANLTANPVLLREMAESAGGRFLREEEAGELPRLLEPQTAGIVVETELRIWQSYWWFTPIVLALALELYLRKRGGLL